MNPKEIADNLDLAQTILEQWLRFREYYLKGISGAPITPQEESDYLETTSAIAQNVRKLAARIDTKKFPIRHEEISVLMKGHISISHFRNKAPADQATFYKEWHMALVYLSRLVGMYKFLQEGYRPPEKGKKKAKFGAKQVAMGVGAVVVLALVALVLMNL